MPGSEVLMQSIGGALCISVGTLSMMSTLFAHIYTKVVLKIGTYALSAV